MTGREGRGGWGEIDLLDDSLGNGSGVVGTMTQCWFFPSLCFCSCFFETGFLCEALAVLELSL